MILSKSIEANKGGSKFNWYLNNSDNAQFYEKDYNNSKYMKSNSFMTPIKDENKVQSYSTIKYSNYRNSNTSYLGMRRRNVNNNHAFSIISDKMLNKSNSTIECENWHKNFLLGQIKSKQYYNAIVEDIKQMNVWNGNAYNQVIYSAKLMFNFY